MRKNTTPLKTTSNQRGLVSLFIVIFTTMILTVTTISFMQLMTRDQRQSSYSDLSESAYDSAEAGVEDAKRALLIQKDCEGKTTPYCEDVVNRAINSGECNTLSQIFGNASDPETLVKVTEGDNKLDQAYTCVIINTDTPDYVGSLDPSSGPILIPLRGSESFDSIVISWAKSERGGSVNLPSSSAPDLPKIGTAWPNDRPSLLRAQVINGGDSFNLSDFDQNNFSNTLFLYPSSIGTVNKQFSLDNRLARSTASSPQLVGCTSPVASGAYACKVTLQLGSPVGADKRTAFLNLSAFYNSTDFKVELVGSNFRGVLPEIDSTGRANDLFRRIITRVRIDSNFNYPAAALEVSGNLCKNFKVTDNPSDYANDCTP